MNGIEYNIAIFKLCALFHSNFLLSIIEWIRKNFNTFEGIQNRMYIWICKIATSLTEYISFCFAYNFQN